MRPGIFITFEGPEGSGKSTQIRLLAQALRRAGRRVVVTREPGGTPLSAAFRRILLQTGEGLTPLAELFLYEADRAQHMEQVVRPALKRGAVVLCDRHADSTTAYQGYGRGLDLKTIQTLNRIATGGLTPDLTLLLDVPVKIGLRRAHAKKKKHDRLERAGLAFHNRVRHGFLKLARREPHRIKVIPVSTINETQQTIRQTLSAVIPAKAGIHP